MLENYEPQNLSIIEVYSCSLNKSGPFVGFLMKDEPSGEEFLVRRSTLLAFLKEHLRIQNVELFELPDIEGLMGEPFAIRSTKKSFSLFSGDHVRNIDKLQRDAWKGIIDPDNPVQMLFTTLF